MITLYHGTGRNRADKIIQSGRIQHWVDRFWEDTSDGYVYLTDSINSAIMWANKNHLIEKNPRESCFVVFECRIDENELVPDIDELKIQHTKLKDIDQITALESLQICRAARISRDLVIGTDIIRYMELPNANYFEHPLLHVTKACVRVRTNIDCSEEFIWKQAGC